MEGFAGRGVKPLRVSFSGKARTSIIEHTLDHKIEIHELKPELDKLEKKLDDLTVDISDIKKQLHTATEQKFQRLSKRLIAMQKQETATFAKVYGMKQKMIREIVDAADVICTTCITSACAALKVADFPVVYLDEASMSTEPASLIPLMKGVRETGFIRVR